MSNLEPKNIIAEDGIYQAGPEVEAAIPSHVAGENNEGVTKDLFYANFSHNLSFSSNLTMNSLSDSLYCYSKPQSTTDQLIPTDLMLGLFNYQVSTSKD